MNTMDFIKEKLEKLYPGIDLSAGSPVDRELIQPLQKRLGDDILTATAGEIIRARLSEEYPEFNGIQTDDLLIKPADLVGQWVD